jgi:hypothetical protein
LENGGRNGDIMDLRSICRSGYGDNRSVIECHINTGGSVINEQGHGGGTSQRAEDKRSGYEEKHDQEGKDKETRK